MVASSGLTEQEVARSTCAVLAARAACIALPPAPVTGAASAPRECIVTTVRDNNEDLARRSRLSRKDWGHFARSRRHPIWPVAMVSVGRREGKRTNSQSMRDFRLVFGHKACYILCYPVKLVLKFLHKQGHCLVRLLIVTASFGSLATIGCMSSVEKVAYGGLPDQITEPVNTVASTANMEASNANSLIGGLVGPNSVSGDILTSQGYNRTANAAVQDPWYAYSLLRGAFSQ